MSATISSIPASALVNVTPSVVGTGGSALQLIELMLTTNPIVPVGSVLSFPSLSAVQAFFGATANEAAEAAVYFAGFNGATQTPAALLFAQYPLAAVPAYVRGGSLSLTLAQLQALTGNLSITTDAGTHSVTSYTGLSAATSFSQAAQILLGSLPFVGPTVGSVTASVGATFTATGSGTNLTTSAVVGLISVGDTIAGSGVTTGTTIVSQTSGTTGGAGVYVTSLATTSSGASITGSSLVLNVTAVGSGSVSAGNQITGTGITGVQEVASQLSGTTGGIGTYQLTNPAGTPFEVASETMAALTPAITWNSTLESFVVSSGTTGATSSVAFPTGTLATSLGLTVSTGAVQSIGAAAAVPASFMAGITALNQDWVTFQTLFDPDSGSGNTQKQAFAAWVNSTNNQYAYLAWDHDITPTESTAATSSLGYILKQSQSSGTVPIYEPSGQNLHGAAFVGGYAASIDYNATNGRATAAYRNQSGLVPGVTNQTVAANLVANGYNFYGGYASRSQSFNFFQPGQISGEFAWIDSYLDQIWLNSQCQGTLLALLAAMNSIPYNPIGYGYIRHALTNGANGTSITLPAASPVAAALNNGIIQQNVPLSAEQVQVVNALAGTPIDATLSAQGWYLVIQPATAQTRGLRQSPTIILLYMDGGSVQQINLSSVLVQ